MSLPNREAHVIIRRCEASDVGAICEIINDAARAYQGVIPEDCRHEPYMPLDELIGEIEDGIVFWGLERRGRLLGVMGIQDKGDVTLIRHAYVRTETRRSGIGTRLLRHLEGMTNKAILIGTWAASSWAVAFYQENGYTLVTGEEKDRLLRKYWSIPERQVETSVVLANPRSLALLRRFRSSEREPQNIECRTSNVEVAD
jgi:N-acetylglutamate synthase-like GNAT family acetyltransferase